LTSTAAITDPAGAAVEPAVQLVSAEQQAELQIGAAVVPRDGLVTAAAITKDLAALSKKATDTVKDLTNRAAAQVNNLVSDLKVLYKAATTCLAAMDSVRILAMTRAFEYHTAVLKTLADAEVLPNILIEKVFQNVGPSLQKDPKPQLWRLMNPATSVYNNAAINMVAIDSTTLAANLAKANVRAFFYVHGWMYDGSKEAAWGDWSSIEPQAGFFTSGGVCTIPGVECHVYLLAYDTSYPLTWDSLIKTAFANVLATTVTGTPRDLFMGVVWREYERRARVAGDYLATMLTPYTGGFTAKHVIMSHSLGSYTVAHAAHKMYTARPNDSPRFRYWFPMASAVPSNAFAPTGLFYNAPKIVQVRVGMVRVYHSAVDQALSTIYFLANSGSVLAMGQIGASCSSSTSCPYVYNEDTTLISREAHQGLIYFASVMPMVASQVAP